MLSLDPFLGSFLDRPTFSVTSPKNCNRACFGTGKQGFADAKVSSNEPKTGRWLQDVGFRLIDTNVQLDRPVGLEWPERKGFTKYEIRFARNEDRPEIENIAGNSFVFSRFHLDPDIPNESADQLKSAWAGNYFEGKRGDNMVVASIRRNPVAFLQLLQQSETLVIDLIAVSASHQGKGLATEMIRFAAENCGVFQKILVGTQIANVPSLRVYEKLGFRICGASYVFHYHGPIDPDAVNS